MKSLSATLVLFLFATISAYCASEAGNSQVSYYKDIRPIFQANCQGCHQPAKAKGDYIMTDFSKLLSGGDSEEPAIIAGQPDQSYLV